MGASSCCPPRGRVARPVPRCGQPQRRPSARSPSNGLSLGCFQCGLQSSKGRRHIWRIGTPSVARACRGAGLVASLEANPTLAAGVPQKGAVEPVPRIPDATQEIDPADLAWRSRKPADPMPPRRHTPRTSAKQPRRRQPTASPPEHANAVRTRAARNP